MDHPFNPTSPREVVSLCRRYGLQPRRSLGQHFLVDGNVAAHIIADAAPEESDAIVEIGPGLGALTLNLAARGNNRVTAVEIDPNLLHLLRGLCRSYTGVTLVHADALALDWSAFLKKHCDGAKRVVLLSNLPYNISSPLLYRLFALRFPFTAAVLMLQQEVARRLAAGPGSPDYSGLSVLCHYCTVPELRRKVSRNVFWPRPAVDSAVLRLKPRPAQLSPEEEPLLWAVVRTVFRQRRKMLVNSLATLLSGGRARAKTVLAGAGLEPGLRPESLSVGEFANLCRVIYNTGDYNINCRIEKKERPWIL